MDDSTRRDSQDNSARPEATQAEPQKRILVALDASPTSLIALRHAAQLAALMEAELEGLFVEDANLLLLCGFPFCTEIGSYSGRVRSLSNVSMERQLRAIARMLEGRMQLLAREMPLKWRFHVRRGQVVQELLNAGREASLLSLGRTGQMRRRTLGSTAQSMVSQSSRPLLILGERGGAVTPVTVVYTGTAAAKRAVALARDLAARHDEPLRVLNVPGPGEGAQAVDSSVDSRESDVREIVGDQAVRFLPLEGNVLMTLHTYHGGMLVLPGDRATLVSEFDGPTLLVP